MAGADMGFPLLGDTVKVFDLVNIIAVWSKAYAQGVVSIIGQELFKLYHIAIAILHREVCRCFISSL
jgi:hypothetical protein